MEFENAQYVNSPFDGQVFISATLNGVQVCIPQDPANTHYAEIMRQVEAGELTIADAE
jgi:hypothetical protein